MIPRGLFFVEFLTIFQIWTIIFQVEGRSLGVRSRVIFFSQPREDEERLIGFAELGFLEVKRCFARG